MLRRTALFLVPLALAAAPLAAQSGLSLVGGITSATVSYKDDGGSVDFLKSRSGFAVGLGVDPGTTSGMSFAPELLYVMKGTNVKEWTDYTKFNYVSAPLLLRYNLGSGGPATPFLTAGPTVSFLLSCTVGDEDDSESCDDAYGAEESYKKLDYGAMVGAGVKFGRLAISARYELGLANITKESNATEKNKTLLLLGSVSF